VLFAAGAVTVERWMHRYSACAGRRLVTAWMISATLFAFPLSGELFASCDEVARTDHPMALPPEGHLPVFACREPRMPLSRAWPRLRRFANGM
jgi:hypothetical protein